ncbi:hypothetical protein NMY22_g16095 [Coprinellus aureogranulatus]|nr:hypothetical protein NMY22_g16095 [Coprinellus aureogranulatus]
MQFTYLLSALTVLAATGGTIAQEIVTYRGYSNTVSCSGDNFFCRDGGAVCCSLPTGFGFSAQFENLPGGSQGQGYTGGGCSDFLFQVFGPGTKCWNGGGARATHLNWFHSPQRRAAADGKAENCATPDGFEYRDAAGVQHTINIPAGNATAAEEIAKHYTNKDWKALSKLESA